MTLRTGYVFSEIYLRHELDASHPESPNRLRIINERLARDGLFERLTPIEPLGDTGLVLQAIAQVHTQEHIEDVRECRNTGDAALAAVSGVLAATAAVIHGDIDNAFCAVRPPGHHVHNDAHRDGPCKGEGFCFFNNVAIAARYAQTIHSLKRVLIVDWDYHHGNGTEDFFFTDNSVFYFSTHRLHAYPGTGFATRTGEGDGVGYNLNVPLPSAENPYGRVDDDSFLSAFNDRLFPTLEKVGFTPDIIFISAGFDSRQGDSLGDFSVSDNAFTKATELVMKLADTHCDGRIVSVLEGGYAPNGLASSVSAHVEALLGQATSTQD